MKYRNIIFAIIFFFFCSKNNSPSEIPFDEETNEAKLEIKISDTRNDPFSSGVVKVIAEIAEEAQDESLIQTDRRFTEPIGTSGKVELIFPKDEYYPANENIKIKEITVFDHMFRDKLNRLDEFQIEFGQTESKTYRLSIRNPNIFWEEFSFSREHNLTGKKILIIPGEGFDYNEYIMIPKYLNYYGAEYYSASNKILLTGHENKLNDSGQIESKDTETSVDFLIKDVDPENYDCIFFPGGSGPENLLAEYPQIKNFVQNAYEKNVPLAAICHGPMILAESGVIDGKNVTGYAEIDMVLITNGGNYLANEPVVIDGNIITGNWPYFNSMANAIISIF